MRDRSRFGAMLAGLRNTRGYSQRELADACEIDHTYLSKIEHGVMMPSSNLVHRFVGALKCSDMTEDLFEAAGLCQHCGARIISRYKAAMEASDGKAV